MRYQVGSYRYQAPTCPVSVVVLSHNRLDELENNLPPLAQACRQLGYELIIADNASAEDVREYLTSFQRTNPEVVLILNDTNLGVAGGRNCTFEVAHGGLVLSIDDDTRVSLDLLKSLSFAMDAHPGAGVLALRVKHAQTLQDQNPHGEREIPVANHHGAACLIRRDVLATIGGMDPLCDFGWEENDFCIRAHAAGFMTVYVPSLVAYHNSFIRPGSVGLERLRKWVFNASRCLHRFFPLHMAVRFSTRYWATKCVGIAPSLGIKAIAVLTIAHLRGSWAGIRSRTPVPVETARFYRNPSLLPSIGNQPFFRSLSSRVLRRILRGRHVNSAQQAEVKQS